MGSKLSQDNGNADRGKSARLLACFEGQPRGLLPWTRSKNGSKVAVVKILGGLWEGR